MELKQIQANASGFIKKYRYVLLILLLGVGLMLLPGEEEQEAETVYQEEIQKKPDLSNQLEQLLSQLKGAGEVKVLLTCAEGQQTIYQSDVHTVSEDGHLTEEAQTVLLNDAQRGDQGLVRQTIPEKYLGAVILCQGAEVPAVRLAIVEAVSNITGLGTNKISVLKMK